MPGGHGLLDGLLAASRTAFFTASELTGSGDLERPRATIRRR
jgi:hypothetical protein